MIMLYEMVKMIWEQRKFKIDEDVCGLFFIPSVLSVVLIVLLMTTN